MSAKNNIPLVPEWALKGANANTMALMGVRDGDKYEGWSARDMLGLELNALKKH